MTTAKIFQTGRSQAVRLPKAFRFEGQEVTIKRVSTGVLLIPNTPGSHEEFWQAWYAALPEVDVPLTREDLPQQERNWDL
ncbi:antitoxin [Deinococcus radiophilus]|uniref:AbrB/MazE/SpoVT family DNA-binding domain-containing protein n=1 Tax=Deinococcus radiophilus TaxID=32062 RepID=A0A431VQ41_9DEIO|nr:AbrB/MazE/SpoVT family DNA-binding domain-containing protein [Deinococcus radiophilus]RTR25317.1 AbrB/MazE/SpoVT family DNA-binding domain-containing protein [Deinococcus radiophilus]UFA52060.1 AbrB/MazE/SpoVT family DNA-binding domain-containing protein [Deinococcus radiophilus]